MVWCEALLRCLTPFLSKGKDPHKPIHQLLNPIMSQSHLHPQEQGRRECDWCHSSCHRTSASDLWVKSVARTVYPAEIENVLPLCKQILMMRYLLISSIGSQIIQCNSWITESLQPFSSDGYESTIHLRSLNSATWVLTYGKVNIVRKV